MFDIGWSELLIVAVVAIIVVGPRDLPRMLRTVGQQVGRLRRMAGDFRSQFDDALKEADLDDLKKDVDSLRSLNPANALKKEIGSINQIGKDIKKSVTSPDNLVSDATDTASSAANEMNAAPSRPARSRPARPEQEPAKGTASKKKAKPKTGKSEAASSS